MKWYVKLLINAAAVYIAAWLLSGVHVGGIINILIVALVLGFLNSLVRPVLVFLTLPVTVLTLGLFLLVINALIVLLADALIPGFEVNGFIWALLFSLITSFVASVLEKWFAKK